MNQQTQSFQPIPSQSPEPAIYTHPDDVVGDPRLTSSEKRAVLASWISDARAVENAPGWRRLDSGAIVEFDVIRRSLNALEGPEARAREPRERPRPTHPGRGVVTRLLSRVRSNDNDDDPPPAPAGLAAPLRPTFVTAYGARPERPRMYACA